MERMDFDSARFNMIEQQIRPAEVLDPRVLKVIANTPREDFVPEAWRKLAFVDTRIPLGDGQEMLTPIQEARILQALQVRPDDRILEIGTGSGYMTALLARLGGHVTSIDINQKFVSEAQTRLTNAGISNVTLEVGDAAAGWEQGAPWDVIVITGSLPLLPETFRHCLNVGGRLCAVIGDPPVMECMLITRTADDEWQESAIYETEVAPLINAPQPQRFVF